MVLIKVLLMLSFISCQTSESNKAVVSSSESIPTIDRGEAELWSKDQRISSANYYFMLAEDRELSQDRKTASKFYEFAYDLDPNSYLASKLISAKAYTDPERAFQQAQRMSLLYPKSIEIHTILGQFLLARGELKKAQVQFKKLLKMDSKSLNAYFGLIQTSRAQGNIAESINYARKAVEVDPSFAEGWATLAKLYLGEKQLVKAHKAARRAYQMRSNYPEFMHLYAITLELQGQSKQAVAIYEALFRLHGSSEELITKMVGLYKQIGSLKEALGLLEEVRERGEASLAVELQIVFIHWELKNFSRAAKYLRVLHKKYPDNNRITYMNALGAEKMKEFKRAKELYLKISENSEFIEHSWYRLIAILRIQGELNEAIEVAKKGIKSGGDKASEFYIVLSNIFSENKKFDKSVELLSQAIVEYPRETGLWFLLGVNQERSGDVEACIETMKSLIRLDPNFAGAYNYLGYLYAERSENLDEAEILIKKALGLKPNDGYYLDSLGWVYFQQANYKKALKTLLKANQIAPNEGVILEHIGDTYNALGQIDKAYEYYEKATKGRIDERDKKRIMQKYLNFKSK